MKKIFLFFSLILALSISACNFGTSQTVDNSNDQPGSSIRLEPYSSVNPEQLLSMLEDKDFTLIDVHIPEQEHISETDLVIPYTEIAKNLDKLPLDFDSKIVVYCRSGGMSQSASAELVKMGYTNVINLTGGKRAYDEYMAIQDTDDGLSATEQVDFIGFEASVLSSSAFQSLSAEPGGDFSGLVFDVDKTQIYLILDNHRKNLEEFDYRKISTLDDQPASSWSMVSSLMGGHHVAGILTFDADEDPNILKITGLPVGDVDLIFKSS